MSESKTVELSENQIKLLKRGLMYVKRSRMFETVDPTEELVEKRDSFVTECDELQNLLEDSLKNS